MNCLDQSAPTHMAIEDCGSASLGTTICVGPLGAVPMQTINGGGQHLIHVRGPTQTVQIRHDLEPKYVGPLEMP
jgi:hypothetical protein